MRIYKRRKMTDEDRRRINASLKFRTTKLQDYVVCDFCGASNPTWIYAAHRMSDGTETANWRWCACDICDDAISANEWTVLKERISVALNTLTRFGFTPSQVRRAVEAAFESFFLDAEEEGDG